MNLCLINITIVYMRVSSINYYMLSLSLCVHFNLHSMHDFRLSDSTAVTKLFLCPLFKCFNHESRNLVRDGGADSRIQGVGKYVFDAQVDLGGWRRLRCERTQRPPRDEALEDRRRISRRRRTGWIAAHSLDRDAGHAVQTAGEFLVEATPADVQVGQSWPFAAGVISSRPLPDARFGAVRHKLRVRVHVGDELVELVLAIR